MSKPAEAPTPRLIRIKEVINKTGMSRAAVYDQMNQQKFPNSIKLSGVSTAWNESEVDQWIHERIAASRKDGGAK